MLLFLSGSWSRLSSSASEEFFLSVPFSLKCKSGVTLSDVIRWCLQPFWGVYCPSPSGISSSHHFGPTKSTTSTASWCWFWLSCASWLCVSPSCAHTSCSTQRTTDGELTDVGCFHTLRYCLTLAAVSSCRAVGSQTLQFPCISFPGNGQASFLLHPLLFTFTCTPFTTIFSKQSE